MSPDRGTRSDAEYAARLIGPWSGPGGSLPDSDYGKRRRRRAALCPQEARRRGARAGRSATGLDGRYWQGSVYARLRTELAGGRVVRRSHAHGSRLPCHTGILTWVIEVDAAVGSWEPHGKTTVDRLHQLAGRGFRPQDCELIDGTARRLNGGCWRPPSCWTRRPRCICSSRARAVIHGSRTAQTAPASG